MARLSLFIPLWLCQISTALVGAEIMAPIFTDGRVQSIFPDMTLLGIWSISLLSLAAFAYNLGAREAAYAAAKKHDPTHVCSGCGSIGWTGNCEQCIPW